MCGLMKRSRNGSAKQEYARRVTLRDVAQEAGVSRSTVSLVLQDSDLVADKTRAHVLDTIQRIGYVYHRAAASLRTASSQMVGLVVPDITNPFFAEMTVGIESQVDAASYVAILGNSGELLSKQQRLLTSLQEYPVDGILLCPAKQTPVGVIEHLQHSRVPFVLFTRYLHGTDADYVGADNVSGAALACEHLIAHGHRRIAFVGGPLDSSARGERIQGYSGVLERHGIVLDESLMAITPTTREGGYHAILELLQLPDPPTAAF